MALPRPFRSQKTQTKERGRVKVCTRVSGFSSQGSNPACNRGQAESQAPPTVAAPSCGCRVYFSSETHAVAGWSGRGLGWTSGEAKLFLFSLAEPVKTLATLFHHSFFSSSVLPPCGSLSVHVVSLTCAHCCAGVSPWSADYWTSDLCQDRSFPTCLSPFSCFPALCPFPLSSQRLVLLSLCCTRSCGQSAEGVLIWPRAVSPTEPYGARLMRRWRGGADKPSVCSLSLSSVVVERMNSILYPEKRRAVHTSVMWPFFRRNRGGA